MSDDEDDGEKTMIMAPSAAGKRQPAPKARLVCVDTSVLVGASGSEIHLGGHEVTVGRGTENTVAINAEGMSRAHARFYPGDGKWGLADLGSTNGVRINNSKIESSWLKDGDTVAIGRVCYKYEVVPEVAAKPESAAPQIDLSDGEKTVVMKRVPQGSAPAAAATPKPAAAATPKPAAAATPKPKTTPKPAPAKTTKSDSGAMIWIFIGIGAALIGLAVALLI